MAQTKTRNSRSSSSSGKTGSKSGSRSGSTSKTRSRSASSSGSKRKSTARKRQPTTSKSTIATVAEKAKVPALAGGAALVGLAGGMALKNGRKRGVLDRLPTPKKLPKLNMPDVKPDSALKNLSKAAGEVAQRSRQVGDVASEVEKASKAIGKKA
jgi:hypothetical protein